MANDFNHEMGSGTITYIEVRKELDYSIELEIDAVPEIGTFVKLVGDYKVEAVSAVTDKPVGYVIAESIKNGVQKATIVLTGVSAIINCQADGAVTLNTDVAISGTGTDGYNKAKAAVATNYAAGFSLGTVADTEVTAIAVYSTSILVA